MHTSLKFIRKSVGRKCSINIKWCWPEVTVLSGWWTPEKSDLKHQLLQLVCYTGSVWQQKQCCRWYAKHLPWSTTVYIFRIGEALAYCSHWSTPTSRACIHEWIFNSTYYIDCEAYIRGIKPQPLIAVILVCYICAVLFMLCADKHSIPTCTAQICYLRERVLEIPV